MDELLAASEVAAGQPDSDANYQRLAAEQAALRRLATLVAGGGRNRRRCSRRWSKKCANAW
jgi:hypothetical protein